MVEYCAAQRGTQKTTAVRMSTCERVSTTTEGAVGHTVAKVRFCSLEAQTSPVERTATPSTTAFASASISVRAVRHRWPCGWRSNAHTQTPLCSAEPAVPGIPQGATGWRIPVPPRWATYVMLFDQGAGIGRSRGPTTTISVLVMIVQGESSQPMPNQATCSRPPYYVT